MFVMKMLMIHKQVDCRLQVVKKIKMVNGFYIARGRKFLSPFRSFPPAVGV